MKKKDEKAIETAAPEPAVQKWTTQAACGKAAALVGRLMLPGSLHALGQEAALTLLRVATYDKSQVLFAHRMIDTLRGCSDVTEHDDVIDQMLALIKPIEEEVDAEYQAAEAERAARAQPMKAVTGPDGKLRRVPADTLMQQDPATGEVKPAEPPQKAPALLALAQDLGCEADGQAVVLAVRLLLEEKRRTAQHLDAVVETASIVGRNARLVELPDVPHRGKRLKWKQPTKIGVVKAGEWIAFSGELAKRLDLEQIATAQGESYAIEVALNKISTIYGSGMALNDLLELADE